MPVWADNMKADSSWQYMCERRKSNEAPYFCTTHDEPWFYFIGLLRNKVNVNINKAIESKIKQMSPGINTVVQGFLKTYFRISWKHINFDPSVHLDTSTRY